MSYAAAPGEEPPSYPSSSSHNDAYANDAVNHTSGISVMEMTQNPFIDAPNNAYADGSVYNEYISHLPKVKPPGFSKYAFDCWYWVMNAQNFVWWWSTVLCLLVLMFLVALIWTLIIFAFAKAGRIDPAGANRNQAVSDPEFGKYFFTNTFLQVPTIFCYTTLIYGYIFSLMKRIEVTAYGNRHPGNPAALTPSVRTESNVLDFLRAFTLFKEYFLTVKIGALYFLVHVIGAWFWGVPSLIFSIFCNAALPLVIEWGRYSNRYYPDIVADNYLSYIRCLKISAKLIWNNLWFVFVIFCFNILILICGILTICGIFIAIPMMSYGSMFAFRQIFGFRLDFATATSTSLDVSKTNPYSYNLDEDEENSSHSQL